MILFRADKRDFVVGDVIATAGEYVEKFKHKTRVIEDRFEDFRPPAKPRRADCLFLFETLAAAKKHWSIMSGGKLYKVEISEDSILHRGDMNWLDVIAKQMDEGLPVGDSYRSYWDGKETDAPTIEVLVPSGRVVEVVSKSQAERQAFLKERYWGKG